MPAKGFLPLSEELAVAAERGLDLSVNWGRSVIETRRVDGAREHLAAVVAAGRLGALVFSGASDADIPAGPAWADVHPPVRDWSADDAVAAVVAEAATSLLTVDEVNASVAVASAAPALRYLGLKVASPSTATPEQCLALIAANVAIVAAARR